jgi:hypothetical protein
MSNTTNESNLPYLEEKFAKLRHQVEHMEQNDMWYIRKVALKKEIHSLKLQIAKLKVKAV